jgi:hypothetical protein
LPVVTMGELKTIEAAGVVAVPDSPSDSETNGVNAPRLPDRYADESYKLFSKVQVEEPTPEEARIIRNKCLWRILPFLCIGYHLMYVDKQTVCAFRSMAFPSLTSLCSLEARPSSVSSKTLTSTRTSTTGCRRYSTLAIFWRNGRRIVHCSTSQSANGLRPCS